MVEDEQTNDEYEWKILFQIGSAIGTGYHEPFFPITLFPQKPIRKLSHLNAIIARSYTIYVVVGEDGGMLLSGKLLTLEALCTIHRISFLFSSFSELKSNTCFGKIYVACLMFLFSVIKTIMVFVRGICEIPTHDIYCIYFITFKLG